MGLTTLTLPRLGETMEEARVTLWLVAPGDAFRRGDVLLEVETDKTVVEVPALTSGTLNRQLVAVGETVQLDQPIAEVEVEGEVATAAPAAPVAAAPALAADVAAAGAIPTAAPAAGGAPGALSLSGARPKASPRARAMARRTGVDLGQVAGSGRGGRITGEDVARLGLEAANDAGRFATPFGLMSRRVRHAQGASRMPVVLLHGLFDDSRGWRDLPDRLARSGHPVILPDLPGHGASPATVNSIDEAEAALVACLPAAGPLILAGHSLGAVLAVRLALRLGPRARRLVLSAPAGLGPRISQDFVDAMMAADSPAALEAALRPLGGGPVSGRALAAELARLQGLRGAIGPLARALAEGGAQKVDLRADLARIECPIAAMFGLEDRILDWRDCAGLPAAAAIHLVAGAGHLPHLAEPALFVDLLTQQDHVAAARPPPARLRWGTEAR